MAITRVFLLILLFYEDKFWQNTYGSQPACEEEKNDSFFDSRSIFFWDFEQYMF